jgi:TfoX/Sxy family transcriptional regulator of competence genes
MAYDLELAERIRRAVSRRRGVAEKAMFGGLAFLLDGKMFVGIVKDDLMVRVGPERHDAALAEPHVRPMDFAGRPMKGYVYVGPAGCREDADVARWAERAIEFVATLEESGRAPRKKAAASGTTRKSAPGPAPKRPRARAAAPGRRRARG